jgi:hypothetical protein
MIRIMPSRNPPWFVCQGGSRLSPLLLHASPHRFGLGAGRGGWVRALKFVVVDRHREDEINFLLKRQRLAWKGEGQVVLISGEPGIGKSRLAAARAERIADEPHTRLRYQCSPYTRNHVHRPPRMGGRRSPIVRIGIRCRGSSSMACSRSCVRSNV